MNKSANQDENQINPAKLLLSKWTAVVPMNKEKHFLVTRVDKDEKDTVISCFLEAVMTRNEYSINWQELKDKSRWLAGWL
ncbi:MAG: TIGR02450 family Trp-rich protein [Methylococcaceae bacterium]|nr:TIGR02450 family Trp-rich protein [Methylococcaceae bacterium]